MMIPNGRRAALLTASAATASLLSMSAALAQSASPIAYCKETTTSDKDRIACLESAINALMGAGPTAPVAAEAEVDQEEEARLAAAEQAADPEPTGLGAEQVTRRVEQATDEGKEKRKKREKAQEVEARVLDFARNNAGRLILVLDNGQVWAQRAGDSQEVRLRDGDKPSVYIRRGAISGYRMQFDSPNVTIVVERLK